jgi:hypothetical protein
MDNAQLRKVLDAIKSWVPNAELLVRTGTR